jgi:hypothetical protein
MKQMVDVFCFLFESVNFGFQRNELLTFKFWGVNLGVDSRWRIRLFQHTFDWCSS